MINYSTSCLIFDSFNHNNNYNSNFSSVLLLEACFRKQFLTLLKTLILQRIGMTGISDHRTTAIYEHDDACPNIAQVLLAA